MDYSKHTKQELIDLVSSQQTLADAVKEKDKEISRLEKVIKELNVREQELVPKHEVHELNDRVYELEKKLNEHVSKEDVKKITQQLEDDLKKARQIGNMYIQSHRDLMRVLKVNLDLAISHEDLLSEKLK